MATLLYTRGGLEGGTIEAQQGQSILEVLLRDKAILKHDCGGQGQCSTCTITVKGEQGSFSAMQDKERLKLKEKGFTTDGTIRLACQTKIEADAVIDLAVSYRIV